MNNKINLVLTKYPILSEHIDLVKFVLEIREAFKLEKVPFQIKVGDWQSGSLKPYYKKLRDKSKKKAKKYYRRYR